MRPLEAWPIISANLANLYKLRRAMYNDTKGYTDAEVSAEVICFKALQEMDEKLKSTDSVANSEPGSADEYLQLLYDLSIDYDGCNTVESLKGLIDELVELSQEARQCLREDKIFEESYK